VARRRLAVMFTSFAGCLALTVPLAAGAGAEGSGPPSGPAMTVLEPTAVMNAVGPAPTKAGILRAVGPALASPALGRFSAVVIDPTSEDAVLAIRSGVGRTPASTMKLLTAASALMVLGSTERLATTVVVSGSTLTLVGGGDATLTRVKRAGAESATLKALARQVADQIAASPINLRFDNSLFSGPVLGPGWSSSFPAAGVIAPVTALMVDQGRVRPGALSRVTNPSKQAAQVFADLLRADGVTVTSIRMGTAPPDATEIARVQSPTIGNLVERMLTESDNDLAEALAHLVGGRLSGRATFATGAAGVEQTAAKLGLQTAGLVVADGSGLSGQNTVSPVTLAQLLSDIARQSDPGLWQVGSGLPVSGFTGTLADRFARGISASAAGYVRAKTGTLTGVVALAGTVKDVDGRVLVFAVLANGVTSLDAARRAVDDFSSRLANCGCTS
jgi:D-alanyl-D-alanine carboxypeptidase/D-alanyl-D-alanine-endopeptidase (penicillin-binding protein 4)